MHDIHESIYIYDCIQPDNFATFITIDLYYRPSLYRYKKQYSA